MKLTVVSVFDKAVSAYGRPAFVPAIGSAVRSFTDEVNRSDANNPMFGHASDFELCELGEFDDESGKFVNLDQPRLLVRGGDVKVK